MLRGALEVDPAAVVNVERVLHRRLLAEYLAARWDDVNITHLG